jgi:RNA polymerase sigma-70 factor, ECF subfamily
MHPTSRFGRQGEHAYVRAEEDPAQLPRARFENLLDRYERRLRGVCHGMLADPHRVDDVLQEAFFKAYRALPKRFENERLEAAWLYRIVYRCCIDEIRSERRRREQGPVPEAAAHPTDETVITSLAVTEALAGLTPDARAVVLLVDLIGLDYDTVAAVLGVPRGTVASRLNTTRAKLRQALTTPEGARHG